MKRFDYLYLLMIYLVIPVGVSITMVSCGPSREEIDVCYETKSVYVECTTLHGIETLYVCTKMPKKGYQDYDRSFRLRNGTLSNYWHNRIAGEVTSFRLLPETAPSEDSVQTINHTLSVNYTIRLPEHYTSITMDSNHPTDLTGFIRNDTIIINFKNY